LGYIDAEYLRFIDAFNNDVANIRAIQNTPKWTGSATLGASFAGASGMIDFSTTLSFRSKTNQFEVPSPFLDQKGYSLWDANLVWTSDDDRFSLGLHGKNLTNKRYKTSGYQFLSVNPDGSPRLTPGGALISSLGREGVVTAFYGNPRQIFLTAGLKF
jgi:iron complex outermembrane recepter protein